MILADKEKEEVKIEGNKVNILTELSILVDELRSDCSDDEIMYAVKVGMTGGDLEKLSNILLETLKKALEEYNENTKENNL